jgi:hypothetical protein
LECRRHILGQNKKQEKDRKEIAEGNVETISVDDLWK